MYKLYSIRLLKYLRLYTIIYNIYYNKIHYYEIYEYHDYHILYYIYIYINTIQCNEYIHIILYDIILRICHTPCIGENNLLFKNYFII